MKTKLMFFTLVALSAFFLFGCQQDPGLSRAVEARTEADTDNLLPVKLIQDRGVIRYFNLEGGFYGIVGLTGNYDPINLPAAFQQNGLAVEFTALVCENQGSIHQWGTVVELISLESVSSERRLIMDTGLMEHYNLQGSPWVIYGSTGRYQPINLPHEFMVENLNVQFVGVIRDDIIIIPPLSPVVELLSIERVDGGPQVVKLNQAFKLPVKSVAFEPGSTVVLTFKSVLRDSRCPIGVDCIWPGEAVVLVNIEMGGRNYGDFELSTYNQRIIDLGAYYIRLIDLQPYPDIHTVIDPDSYVGEFVIGTYMQ